MRVRVLTVRLLNREQKCCNRHNVWSSPPHTWQAHGRVLGGGHSCSATHPGPLSSTTAPACCPWAGPILPAEAFARPSPALAWPRPWWYAVQWRPSTCRHTVLPALERWHLSQELRPVGKAVVQDYAWHPRRARPELQVLCKASRGAQGALSLSSAWARGGTRERLDGEVETPWLSVLRWFLCDPGQLHNLPGPCSLTCWVGLSTPEDVVP